MSEQKKAIDMTPEELKEWLASLPAPKDDLPRLPFSDLDPYFKMEHTPREQGQTRLFNEDGHLTVRNYCAMALPQITVTIHSGLVNDSPLQWQLRRKSQFARKVA